ncbi:DUF3298 and DUF4163 domain-containing protein [Chryseosolibacter indicus]|uniref:DUF3298 domain-containing protein n=1 Tax=Chryseosolibacter indicus TaxID=2782351 RepID=A0ABS5VJK4_9BACT|nr:DUF3298 and DUF4163 domain-containing protein [Chryseosolibacter indicus]MBT1701640.1 DUF3298 domain-containing protein [Chryseosolibacter indicus]
MVLRLFALISFCFLIVSCAVQEKAVDPVGITYSMDMFSRSSTCKDSSNCARYTVSYPVFENLDSTNQRLIKSKIDAIVSMGNPEAKGWTMEKIANEFIKEYENFYKQSPDLTAGPWHYKAQIDVESSLDTLISLSVKDEYFTGGAHGGSGTYFINVNPKAKKYFTLDDFFKPGYRDALIKEGEKLFRKERQLADTASYVNNGFEFADDVFQLNENYGFTATGITFVFNNYEVAPYAAGPTTIEIPYDRMKDWFK